MQIEITDKQRRIILQALIEYEQDANRYLVRAQIHNETDIDLVRLEEFVNNIKETRKLFDTN